MTADTRYLKRRIFLLGATGTIGRATLTALVERGHEVVAFVRPSSIKSLESTGAEIRLGTVTDAQSIIRDGFRGEHFDVLLSCLASRNGTPEDAWRIDYQANLHALDSAKTNGVQHFVLLSAICVQKPQLAFQHAKLAFEKALIESGFTYSIVRPTAFFKSLSGQVERVRNGKPFLLFGNGKLTSCKPISDADLANYLADCVVDSTLQNRILPIGGPGDAITPKQQGESLFALLGKEPRFRHVPVRMLDIIVSGLDMVGRVLPAAKSKAELARIGRYYATESMLVWNPGIDAYDPAGTPSTGSDTLQDHYKRLIEGSSSDDRGEHAVF
jgi:divinyl chlorophyllide a 8-vinyl-reductase